MKTTRAPAHPRLWLMQRGAVNDRVGAHRTPLAMPRLCHRLLCSSARALQEFAGHTNLATTPRYIDVNDEPMRDAIELSPPLSNDR